MTDKTGCVFLLNPFVEGSRGRSPLDRPIWLTRLSLAGRTPQYDWRASALRRY